MIVWGLFKLQLVQEGLARPTQKTKRLLFLPFFVKKFKSLRFFKPLILIFSEL